MAQNSVLPHETLVAYQVACELLVAIRDAEIDDSGLRDQALRSAKSACLNIAEASGRESMADQKRVYAIARGEASEATAAIQIAALSGDCTTDSGEKATRAGRRLYGFLTGLIRRPP